MRNTQANKPAVPPQLDLYTLAETAAILGVSQRSLFNWIHDGRLPAVRLGAGQRLVRIRRVDLEQFIQQRTAIAPTGAAEPAA